jgi:hypothetical protein
VFDEWDELELELEGDLANCFPLFLVEMAHCEAGNIIEGFHSPPSPLLPPLTLRCDATTS